MSDYSRRKAERTRQHGYLYDAIEKAVCPTHGRDFRLVGSDQCVRCQTAYERRIALMPSLRRDVPTSQAARDATAWLES